MKDMFLAGLLFVSANFMGALIGRDVEKGYAIDSGVAEFYLDEENEKQFRYLPPCQVVQEPLPHRIYDDEEENGFRDVPNHAYAE